MNRVYFGTYSLEHWMELLRKGNIMLPKYQRHFVWEKEMTEVDKKKFQRGYKKVIRAMLKSLNGRQEVMTYGVGLINKKNNNSQ